jgi:hypothetical protein
MSPDCLLGFGVSFRARRATFFSFLSSAFDLVAEHPQAFFLSVSTGQPPQFLSQ